jgi:P-type Ca2+ transporter type 2C
VAGEPEIQLDPFLMPMVLASDAVISNGELIGDPTGGALVALAAKGGVDTVGTRQAYPRVAELPFDAAYKLMATFHRMEDESGKSVVRCFVKGAPRPAPGPRRDGLRRRRRDGSGRRPIPGAVPSREPAAR